MIDTCYRRLFCSRIKKELPIIHYFVLTQINKAAFSMKFFCWFILSNTSNLQKIKTNNTTKVFMNHSLLVTA